LTELVRWFAQASTGTKTLIIVLGLLAASIGPLLVMTATLINSFLTIRRTILTLQVGLQALGLSFSTLALPITAAIVVIGLMVAAIIHLWQTNREFQHNITVIWTAIKSIISNTFSAIMPVIQAFIMILGVLIQVMAQIIGWVASVAASFLGWVARMLNTSETAQNVVSALGLLAGIIGTVIAIVLVVKTVM